MHEQVLRIIVGIMLKLLFLIIWYAFYFIEISPANVLAIFPFPSQSHYILGQSLSRGLLEAGYNVTMIGAYKNKEIHENLTSIVVNGMDQLLNDEAGNDNIKNAFELEGFAFKQVLFLRKMGEGILNSTLSDLSVQDLLLSKPIFDVIILEEFTCDGLIYLASHFKAPLILFSAFGSNKQANALIGNPAPPSYVPNLQTPFSNDMNFFERWQNFLYGIYLDITWHYLALPAQSKIIKQWFPEGIDFYSSLSNISLLLVNGHESFVEPVPQVPNVINIGGFHLKPRTEQLPHALEKIIKNAEHGVIYFSMGSILVPSTMPENTLKTILDILSSRKEKVFFKWGSKDCYMAHQYPNILFFQWLPQQDLLAHSNIKIFITHGGIASLTESIHHGVPMLALPVFGDQQTNAARIVKWKIGRSIPFSTINGNNFREALEDVLNNSNYKTNAVYRSKLVQDRLVKPMDLAIYWIDYVIRYKGAPHLRVAGNNLSWYQYLMLDVVAAFLLLVAIFCYLLPRIIVIILIYSRTIVKIKRS